MHSFRPMGDPFVRPGIKYQPHIEYLILKTPGTGTKSTTPREWIVQIHRDMYHSLITNQSDLLTHHHYAAQLVNANSDMPISRTRMKEQLYEKYY